jgi:hypothetical protein
VRGYSDGLERFLSPAKEILHRTDGLPKVLS